MDAQPVDVVAPVVGSGPTFSALTATSLTVNWDAATDNVTDAAALRYKVVRASGTAAIDTLAEVEAITGADQVLDFTADTLTVDVDGLTPATGYAFAIVVEDAAGNRALYAPATVSTLDASAPTVGTGITFANVAATSVTVNWGSATDDVTAATALQYKVVRAASASSIDSLAEVDAITSGAALVLDFTPNTTTAPATSLTSSTSYAFAVVVRDEAGNEALYSPATFTTLDITAPTTGTAISFTSVAATSVTVNWGAATDDVTAGTGLEYKLVRAATTVEIDTLAEVAAITSGAGLVLDFTADITSAPATGLTSSTAYAFAVVVRDAAGNQALYAPAAVTTLDDSDPTMTITGPTAAATFTTALSSVALDGTAADNVAVTSVTWANAANATSGTATGTTSWSVAAVTLAVGGNVITVTATDAAGNTATDTITVTRDNTDPTVTITGPSAAATFATAASSIALAGSASDNDDVASVTWVNAANATSGAATGTTSWSVAAVTLATGDNVISVTATDGAGNTATDTITVTRDNTDPTVTINQAAGQVDPTNVSTINFTVVFSEPVTGFDGTDVMTSGAPVGSKIVTGGPSSYNVAIPATGNGTVTATVSASGAQDAAGNLSAASTSADNTVTLDTSSPTVTINRAAGQADPTNESSIDFTATFSEAVTGFSSADVSTTGSTAAVGTIIVNGGPSTYNIAIAAAGSGTVIAIVASGAAQDAAGNLSATPTNIDNIVTRDVTAPTVTINQAGGQADPTNSSPINFTVVFNEAVTGFTNSDISTTGSTATIGTITVTGGPSTYTVAIAASGSGAVTATVVASAAQDAAGNNSAASTSSADNTVTLDTTAPSIDITSPSAGGSYTTSATTVDLGGSASDAGGINLVSWVNTTNATNGTATGTTTWNAGSVTLAVGTNTVVVTAVDAAGNSNTATITVTRIPASCLLIHLSDSALPSGTYTIDPDGDGGGAPLVVYCDMTTAGGGWTFWVHSGLVAYWSFDGVAAADSDVGGVAGTLEGDAAASATVLSGLGSSVSFGNAEANRITLTGGVATGSASTFVFWGRQESCTNNRIPLLFSNNQSSLGDLAFDARIIHTTGSFSTSTNNCAASVGTWSHHAYIDDGTQYRVIRNGVAVVPSVYSYGSLSGLVLNRFGSRPGFGTNGLHGFLDDVAVFNRALSDAEVQLLRDQALAGRAFRWR